MTTLRDAAQQALEAMTSRDGDSWTRRFARDRAIEALEAALAEPTTEESSEIEPVAWSHNLIDNIITHRPADIDRHPDRWTPLYTAPPQRKPLTEEEIDALALVNSYLAFARAIERAHGIK